MNAFFYYFYNYMRTIFELLWNIVIAIKDAIVGILDVKFYMDLFSTYKSDMSPMGWVAAIIMHILIYALFAFTATAAFGGTAAGEISVNGYSYRSM